MKPEFGSALAEAREILRAKPVSDKEHNRWMTGEKKPWTTRCICHNQDIVVLYNPWRRKKTTVWLYNEFGAKIWNGEQFFLKGVHKVHSPFKLVMMLKRNLTQGAVEKILADELDPVEYGVKVKMPRASEARSKGRWARVSKVKIYRDEYGRETSRGCCVEMVKP